MENQTEKIFAGVRWMMRRDVTEVLDVERRSFDHPLGEEEFLSLLRRRNVVGMVCDHKGRVVAHMLYELHRDRIVVVDFAVHPEFRRQGFGKLMIAKLKSKLNENRRRKLDVMVRETNLGAQLFFRENEFKAVEVVRGHYEDTRESAYSMRFEMEQAFSAAPEGGMPRNRVLKYMQP